MHPCLFVSDLHGDEARWRTLFELVRAERPRGVFLGGDLLPHGAFNLAGLSVLARDFTGGFLAPAFLGLRRELGPAAPEVFLILGNDDARAEEAAVLEAATRGAWRYAHPRVLDFGPWQVAGYSYVPPSPFLLKDWERYDVSRFVDPGCVPPEEGRRSVPVSEREARLSTIAADLEALGAGLDPARAIFLCHAPPHGTPLDRAALDGRMVDHAPVDVHVGSVAVRRFLERVQPRVSLHGHVHEAARLTGTWRCSLGATQALGAAHDGPELAVVRFDPADPGAATRELRPAGPAPAAARAPRR